MFEVRAELSREEFESVENLIFESERMEPWNLYENFDDKGYWVQGVFETKDEAEKGRTRFELLVTIEGDWVINRLEDIDWKESYKEHFKPWSIGDLHWVPHWLKGEYVVPSGDQAVWLDPGMAFGTGNHGTTRLCVEQLLEFKKSRENVTLASVIDAGCGSGILAISAAKMGFERIEGFDIDEDAIRIAVENAGFNEIGTIQFSTCGLEEGLIGKKADCVMANILANVLVANSRLLIDAVSEDGWLILSGILGSEADSVVSHFRQLGGWSKVEYHTLDEWASVTLVKDSYP